MTADTNQLEIMLAVMWPVPVAASMYGAAGFLAGDPFAEQVGVMVAVLWAGVWCVLWRLTTG